MTSNEDIVANLTAQIHELEVLQSVYPKELTIADHGILADINDFIKSGNGGTPKRLEYTLGISMDNGILEMLVSLPSNYPKEKPDVYVRSCLLNRTQQLLLNKNLTSVLHQQEVGECCIYMLISWLQDHAEEYIESKANEEKDEKGKLEVTTFVRYWIYSHHIYSKFKRRDVSTLAKENSITGFCLAGKPGIICMEGALDDCDYCWQKIKAMNWQKILIRFLEKEDHCKSIDNLRKFRDFQEVSFPTSERHNDMGQLLIYLTEHDAQYAFKELFGIEGRTSEMPD